MAGAKLERGGPLEWLRFAAAAFIVLYHFGDDAPIHLDAMSRLLGQGWLATDFFLMLSGYVLGRAYGRSLDEGRVGAGAFVRRRLVRIWPAHLIVLVGFAALVAISHAVGIEPKHPDRYGVADFWLQAGLVHAWGFGHVAGWNVPSWSLSALVVCYALFPLAWRASGRLSAFAALLAAPVLVGGAAVAARGVTGMGLYDLPFDLGVVRAVPLFLGGLLLSRAAVEVRLTPRAAAGIVGMSLAAILLLESLPRTPQSDFTSIIAVALVIVAADAWKTGLSRLAAAGARLSFALFITHALTGAVWFGLVRMLEARVPLPVEVHWLLWAGAFPVALGVAWVFDRLVDAPLQRAIARRRRPREPAAA